MPAKPPRAPRRGGGGPLRRAGRLASGALLAAVLLAAAGHALLWLWVCGRLEAGFAAWAETRRAEGWRVAHGPPLRGGWPFTATLTVPEFRLQGGAGVLPGGVDWRAEAPLVLRVAPPRLDRLAVEAPGRHRLRLGGETVVFAADHLNLALPIEEGAAPREAAAGARRLRFDTPAGVVEIRAASLDFGTRRRGGEPAAAALRVSAADVALPAGLPGTARLGLAVEGVGLDLALTGPVPPMPGLDPARRAAAWRDNGGALEVRAVDARWGETAAAASATLTLDGALQPAGTGTLHLAGGGALLDAAGEAGLLTPFAAAAARVVLRALDRAPREGGPARAELPLVLRDRSLRIAGVPVARLPVWEWGGAPTPGPDGAPSDSAGHAPSPSRD
jgi:hypothetical protein